MLGSGLLGSDLFLLKEALAQHRFGFDQFFQPSNFQLLVFQVVGEKSQFGHPLMTLSNL